jgi:hypothetical protein
MEGQLHLHAAAAQAAPELTQRQLQRGITSHLHSGKPINVLCQMVSKLSMCHILPSSMLSVSFSVAPLGS